MTQLTIEEERFLESNRVPFGAVLDANGLEKPDWRKLIRALEKWVINRVPVAYVCLSRKLPNSPCQDFLNEHENLGPL